METSIGWEFKILRANLPAFRDPLVLKRACEEEAPAGWTMFEKLDDSRIRFRRLTSAKAGDAGLSIDPYRSQFGISTVRYTLILLGAVFLATALILAIVFVAINYFSKH